MIEAEINLWAVLVAGVVSMAIGAVWYNVLSKPWLKAVGLTEKQVMSNRSPMPYVVSFLCMLVIAYVISHVFFYAHVNNPGSALALTEIAPRPGAVEGLMTGFWMWLGFAATVTAINYAYQMKPFKLYAIDAGYTLVFFLTTGAIIGGWQ